MAQKSVQVIDFKEAKWRTKARWQQRVRNFSKRKELGANRIMRLSYQNGSRESAMAQTYLLTSIPEG